jgi:hypothetical protein
MGIDKEKIIEYFQDKKGVIAVYLLKVYFVLIKRRTN